MIQKGSFLVPIDKNGVYYVAAFHIYGGFLKRYARPGCFLKVSVKKIKNNRWLVKKSKVKSIVILVKKEALFNNSYFRFKLNSCILLKKRLAPFGSEIIGPSLNKIARKKLIYSFSGTL